jgi:hypothetical protein
MKTLIKILSLTLLTFSVLTAFSQNPPDTIKIGDSLFIYPSDSPDMSLTIYPENDGITYNQYLGETFAGYVRANGWREDSINGGFGKELYWNPFVSQLWFWKQNYDGNTGAYRYDFGKKYTGNISDTLELNHSVKVENGFYLNEKIKVVFAANCINGMLQGQGTLTTLKENKLIAKCNFENGEIIGECISWDIDTQNETRVTFIKGSEKWTKYIVLDKKGNIIETREN